MINSHFYAECKYCNIRPKNNTLVSGNAGDKKHLHPGDRKKHFFINLTEFFNNVYTLLNYSKSTFLC